jgi:hypothetical protein
VRTSEVVALLDLLTSRGTVAWQVTGPTQRGACLVLDTSGVDSAMRLLVSRGFTATRSELPSHVELAHPRHGRVVLLPCTFSGDGSAVWHGGDRPVHVPADRFDPVVAVPRRVRVAPGQLRPPDGTGFLPEDEAGVRPGP